MTEPFTSAETARTGSDHNHRPVREQIIKGIPVSPGMSFGRPCFHESIKPDHTTEQNKQLSDHESSLTDAFIRLDEQLNLFANAAEEVFDRDAAAIFRAHRMICKEVRSDVLNTLRQGQQSAKDAIKQCFDDYSEYFNNINNDYLSNRANDFNELRDLLLNLLDNTESVLSCREFHGCRVGECALKNEHVLITDELTANVVIRIRRYTKGIITDKCGINSHAGVIARSLGIPVISGIKEPHRLIHHNDMVFMNGSNGEIIVNPAREMLKKYQALVNRPHGQLQVVEPLSHFKVMADIDRHQDVKKAIQVKADGVGLYRTEFEMLYKNRVLAEDEQITIYRNVIEKMEGKPVYFRLFDLGGDKFLPWLEPGNEDNPALGCRGARFLLANPDITLVQVRALAKVSVYSPINVIYPMISSVGEFLQLKKMFADVSAGLKGTNIKHGVMFEVPSACVNAYQLYKVIDFGRIGTNDLLQYLFAYDRTSDDFEYDKLVQDPAIWKIISDVATIARKAGKPVELCGEMARKPEFLPRLIELGITTISTRPEYIGLMRKAALH